MTVRLPGSDLELAPLGLGCNPMVGSFNSRASRRLVDTAIELGIRHFDVAPAYGYGTAEAALGFALRGRRERVSIASKVGIPRPEVGRGRVALRALAAPLRDLLKPLRRAAAAAAPPAATGSRTCFDLGFVQRSVEATLRALRTDYLDTLLLHDPEVGDLSDELLSYLDRLKRDGAVRLVGVGSNRRAVAEIDRARPETFEVYQHEWHALEPRPLPLSPAVFTIVHGSISGAVGRMAAKLDEDPSLRREASEATGFDLADRAELIRVLLGAAMAANRDGITLVGTASRERLRSNAQVLSAPKLYMAAGERLSRLSARFGTKPAAGAARDQGD